MPQKVVETPYPPIDADPHASRVLRYMRPSDYAVWAAATAAFPSALYFWGMLSHRESILVVTKKSLVSDMADPSRVKMTSAYRLGGTMGFIGGFLLAYQRSSCKHIHFLVA